MIQEEQTSCAIF